MREQWCLKGLHSLNHTVKAVEAMASALGRIARRYHAEIALKRLEIPG